MNSETHCSCCQPECCNICKPQSSSKAYVRIGAERRLKPELVCSTKNCNIFGSHDTNPMPQYKCRTTSIKESYENVNCLGSPIGLVASSINFQAEGTTSDIMQARYATYLTIFAQLHLNEEKTWDSLLIDDIMKKGLELFTISQQGEINSESPSDIYTPNEQKILREFQLCGFTFRVELMPAFKLNEPNSSETGANGDGLELTLKDFTPAMKRFFRHHKHALLTVGSFYAIIWRTKDAYFVFDICGRQISSFKADKQKGVAMLICLKCLSNARHLIVNLTGLKTSDPLMIREIKVVKVITPNGGIVQQDYGIRTHEYQVINDDYAYIKSDLHLTLNTKDLLRNRSSLPVAVTAVVASKIDHPATWNMKMLNKIICFGVNFCQNVWAKCGDTDAIDVTEFPTYFQMGQFQIITDIVAQKYQGTWRCVPDFKHGEMSQAFKMAFNAGDHKLLLQMNSQIYAIWKKHDFIYLFDPYRHRILGKPSESEVYEQMEKSASVRMFRSFDVFMNVLNQILLDSNRTSKFFIHIIKIKNIQTRPVGIAAGLGHVEEPKLDTYGEVMSINEHICFEEAEDMCRAALGEISDFEDEDLKSDVDEIELRTSSSEAEDLEEEEAAAGEVEEMEGLESSSSGEEEGGHEKKSRSGKGSSGKNIKGKKSKGSSKGGSHKSKKGQGTEDSETGGKKRKKGKQNENEDSSEDEGQGSKKSKSDKNRDDKKNNQTEKSQGKTKTAENNENKAGKDDKTNAHFKDLNKDKDSKLGKIDGDKEDSKSFTKTVKSSNESKEDRNNIYQDKDKNRDKDPNNNKGSNKDKDLNKDKDPNKYKVPYKDKDLNRDKDLSARRDLNRGKDLNKDKDLNRDKDPSTNKNPPNNKDLKKGKDLNRDEDVTKDTNFDRDKNKYRKNDKDQKEKYSDKGGSKDTSPFNNIDNKNGLNSDDDLLEQSRNMHEGDIENESDKENEKYKYFAKITNFDPAKSKAKDMGKTTPNAVNEFDKNINKDQKHDNDCQKSKETDQDQPSSKDLTQRYSKSGDKTRRERGLSDLYNDGTEADDENEDYLKRKHNYCSGPNPNCYPGYFKRPADMAVVGSECGSYASICKLFQAGFKAADRILTITPWGNFVVFRCAGKFDMEERHYFLFDGCTCNFDHFRYLDLSQGTAGLICFKHIHNVIKYIRQLRKSRKKKCNEIHCTADDICKEFSNKSFNLRL